MLLQGSPAAVDDNPGPTSLVGCTEALKSEVPPAQFRALQALEKNQAQRVPWEFIAVAALSLNIAAHPSVSFP